MQFNLIPEVFTEMYKDLFSSSFKNIGKALGTGTETLNTILLPLSYYNEKRRLIYATNIKRLQENLEKITEEKVVEIPAEIASPILDRFSYVSNDHLAELFHNLLINASSQDTAHIAHPGFISIIDRLAPDEAKILLHMKNLNCIPAISYDYLSNEVGRLVLNNITAIETVLKLTFPQNSNLYFENLTSLGILKILYDSNRSGSYTDKFKMIEMHISDEIRRFEEALSKEESDAVYRNRNELYYDITDFGKMFINACLHINVK